MENWIPVVVTAIIGIVGAVSSAALTWAKFARENKMSEERRETMEIENERLRAEIDSIKSRTAQAARDSDVDVLRGIIDELAERNAGIITRVEHLEAKLTKAIDENTSMNLELCEYKITIKKLTERVESLEAAGKEKDEIIKRLSEGL